MHATLALDQHEWVPCSALLIRRGLFDQSLTEQVPATMVAGMRCVCVTCKYSPIRLKCRVAAGPTQLLHEERAAYRVIENEAEVVSLLERLGFVVDIVDFAGMNYTAQAARARCAHGPVCRPDVLELIG